MNSSSVGILSSSKLTKTTPYLSVSKQNKALKQSKQGKKSNKQKRLRVPYSGSQDQYFSDSDDSVISFEKGLLLEHLTWLRGELAFLMKQNFGKFILKSEQENEFGIGICPDQFLNVHEYLQSGSSLVPNDKVPFFLSYLGRESRFLEFLDFIYGQSSWVDSGQLIYAAYRVWEVYLPMRRQDLSSSELERMVNMQKFIIGIYSDPNFSILHHNTDSNFDKDDSTQQIYRRLKVRFSHTVMLVMDHHFCNPYYQEETNRKQKVKKKEKFIHKDSKLNRIWRQRKQ